MAESQGIEDHAGQTEELGFDFESLVKGMEDIQNHALDQVKDLTHLFKTKLTSHPKLDIFLHTLQHELHLDSRMQLRNLEDTIEKTCQTVKQIKAKNMEDEGN